MSALTKEQIEEFFVALDGLVQALADGGEEIGRPAEQVALLRSFPEQVKPIRDACLRSLEPGHAGEQGEPVAYRGWVSNGDGTESYIVAGSGTWESSSIIRGKEPLYARPAAVAGEPWWVSVYRSKEPPIIAARDFIDRVDREQEGSGANADAVTAAAIIRDLLVTPAAQGEVRVPSWLPIETAPKDGKTVLLGHHNEAGHWRALRGQWCSAEYIADQWDNDDCEEGWYETSVENDEIPNCWLTKPTHWMPLPAAPALLARPEGK